MADGHPKMSPRWMAKSDRTRSPVSDWMQCFQVIGALEAQEINKRNWHLRNGSKMDCGLGLLALNNRAVGFFLELEAVLFARSLVRIRFLPGPVRQLV